MTFRRNESFRFVFHEPIDAEFTLHMNGKQVSENKYNCKILDISPNGMKIYTEAKFDKTLLRKLQFEVQFVLNISSISAIGNVVWSKPFSTGKEYGLYFKNQPDVADTIMSELKIRRRQEVLEKKSNKF